MQINYKTIDYLIITQFKKQAINICYQDTLVCKLAQQFALCVLHKDLMMPSPQIYCMIVTSSDEHVVLSVSTFKVCMG